MPELLLTKLSIRKGTMPWWQGSIKLIHDLEEVQQQVVERQAKGQQMEMFIKKLEQVDIIYKFDDDLFLGLVDVIEISRDKKIVRFKNGSEVEV